MADKVRAKVKRPLGEPMSLDDAARILRTMGPGGVPAAPATSVKKSVKKNKPKLGENIGQRRQLKLLEKEGY